MNTLENRITVALTRGGICTCHTIHAPTCPYRLLLDCLTEINSLHRDIKAALTATDIATIRQLLGEI